MGVPKTIDNDLMVTDHTPGYGSAAKYIATILKEVIRDSSVYNIRSVTVAEIMGRHAGWLAGAACLAGGEDCEGPDLILLPEVPFDQDKFLARVDELQRVKSNVIIAASEGVKTADGTYLCDLVSTAGQLDAFGHKAVLSGTSRYLSDLIHDKLNCKSRAIEFSTLQRCASHLASRTDVNEAYAVGGVAAAAAFAGESGRMIALKRVSNYPYQCITESVDVQQVANLEKKVPLEWITPDGMQVTEAFEEYARPLILDEVTPVYVHGTPRHIRLCSPFPFRVCFRATARFYSRNRKNKKGEIIMGKNAIVGQSGGPTAVINSSLYGVVSEGMRHPEAIEHVYGMINGIEGFLNGTVLDFAEALPGEKLDGLKVTPGAYLGSCRYKLPESLEDPVYPRLFKKFEEMNIGWFFYIGGNDSMDTVSKLSRYAAQTGSDIRILGEPKTIDNDLIHTDHTPGFGSAARYVASTVREITIDANVYEKKSVTIIEIMGRHAGWLTAASALARKYTGDNPLLIYLPETAFDQEEFLKAVENSFEKNCNVIVCVSEGIHDDKGTFICEYDNSVGTDTFGHKMLAGCGKYLENLVRNRLGVKARSVELNVSQRCSASMMSATDQQEAIKAGEFGVQAALNGETGKMISFIRKETSDGTYIMECGLEDVNAICNEEKTVPSEWITEDGSDVTDAFINYARPLIQGTVQIPCGEDGLPAFVYRI